MDKKTEGSQTKKKESNKSEKQFVGFFIFSTIIVLSIFGGFWIVSKTKEFDYIGLTFTKEKFGEIDIYTSPLLGRNINDVPINFKTSFRIDPRENKVPIENSVKIRPDSPVYVALNMTGDLYKCGSVPLVGLGQFLDGLGYVVETTATTEDKAEEFELKHLNCDSLYGATILQLTEADKTEIVVNPNNQDCYEIRVNSCELQEAVERVELSILERMTKNNLN